ncbi:uncharacterized protein O3C94_014987 [Discoglossus pictus]
MKSALVLLLMGMFLLHANALKCRKSACTGSRPCSSTTATCDKGVNQCFVMMKSSPIFSFIRGCITENNCAIMKSFEPSTRCCNTDLCN